MKTTMILILLLLSSPLFAQYDCDTLVFKSGSKLIVRNISYESNMLLYEKCDDTSGATYSVRKDAVTLIKKNKDRANKYLIEDKTYSYEVLVDLKTRPQTYRGLLHQLNDSSIVVSVNNKLETYAVSQINYIRYKKKNSIRRNAVVGAGIGFCSGLVLGIISFPNKSNSSSGSGSGIEVNIDRERAIASFSFLGMLSGTVIGAASGGIRISIPIYGDQRRYEKMKLKKFLSF